jgi:hypothetical protein
VKGLKGKWANVQAMAREKQAERREQKNKDDLVAAAQSYEKRAKQKRAMEKRGGR